jgi:hypothetical protein
MVVQENGFGEDGAVTFDRFATGERYIYERSEKLS